MAGAGVRTKVPKKRPTHVFTENYLIKTKGQTGGECIQVWKVLRRGNTKAVKGGRSKKKGGGGGDVRGRRRVKWEKPKDAAQTEACRGAGADEHAK